MIDLTPLDVRKKRGDFAKILRGYDPQEVDTFLELVAERMEELVMENLQLRERTDGLQKQVDSQAGREQAVQEALVTAQELRRDMKSQAERESEIILGEARTEARRLVAEAEAEVRTMVRDAEARLDDGKLALEELERRRIRFIKTFRQLLERELDVCDVEEEREPLEIKAIDLDLGGGHRTGGARSGAAAEVRDPLPDGVDAGPFPDRGPREDVDPAEVVDAGTPVPGGGTPGAVEGDAEEAGQAAGEATDALVSAATEEVRDILAGLGVDDDDETLGLDFDDPDQSGDSASRS